MSKKSAAIVASVSEDEFKDYIGHNAYKLMRERQAALQGKIFYQSSALLALICIIPFAVIYWLGYHKWWRMLFSIALIVASMTLIFVAFNTPAWINTSVSITLMLMLALWLPIKYVVYASQQIAHFKSLEKDPRRLSILLQKKGGTSVAAGTLAVLFSIILNLSLVYLFAPAVFDTATSENFDQASNINGQESSTPFLVGDSDRIETRYGDVEIVEIENREIITFNGKPVSTKSFDGLSLESHFMLEGRDVILVAEYAGGSACPAEYFFVTINENNTIRLSEKFGTCSDLAETLQDGDIITVSLPNFSGSSGTHIFIFRSGIVEETVQ